MKSLVNIFFPGCAMLMPLRSVLLYIPFQKSHPHLHFQLHLTSLSLLL